VSERKDGHGRTIAVTERIRVNGVIEERDTRTQYLATGEPEKITRWRVNKSDPPVVRWMRYDTLGRMVLNVEPNTSKNFTEDLSVSAVPASNGLKAWRYAYSDAGDLVATSDARGCGINFEYDDAGRLVSEDYSPCEAHHEPYSPPFLDPVTGPHGFEVLYHYDSAPATPYPGLNRPSELSIPAAEQPFFHGRLTAVWDRGSATWTRYDGRGRVIQTAVAAAKPLTAPPQDIDPDPATSVAGRYTTDWSVKSFAFDAADREVATSTGVESPELGSAEISGLPSWFSTQQKKSAVSTEYTRRGTVKNVGGSYGSLVASIERTADGLVTELVYGDAAGTTTSSSYDNRRRLRSVQTYRPPPGMWSNPSSYLPSPAPGGTPTTFQLLLQDEDYSYDVVNNPTEIRDWRLAEEWPDGAKPVTKKIEYDDLYRVTRVSYEYPGGIDPWTSPYAAENDTDTSNDDPRRAKPSPHVNFDTRIQWQSFKYDWLGNTSKTDDDAKGFYDRSLGGITNHTTGGTAAKPYQLQGATQATGARGGALATVYDSAGNLTRLDVKRDGTCLPAGANCSQRYDYQWDEVGRLDRARRWDVAAMSAPAPEAAVPSAVPAADLNYVYDAVDQRVLKTAFDALGEASHTVYLFDSLELRRATFDTGSGEYERSVDTEVGYLSAHGMRLARLAYEEPEVPTIGGARLHVFLELGDHLGSTSIIIDQKTSELVEASRYQAYGGAESDYRPERWKAFREDYRFTGKEEDVEVALQYFGKRFLNPLMGRWVSADPLAVHGLGADLNLYAYVSGSVLKNIDPVGLDKTTSSGALPGDPNAGSGHRYEQGPRTVEVPKANAGGSGSPPSRATPKAAPGSGNEPADDPFSGDKLTPSKPSIAEVTNAVAGGENKGGNAKHGSGHGTCEGSHCIDHPAAQIALNIGVIADNVATVLGGIWGAAKAGAKWLGKKAASGIGSGVKEVFKKVFGGKPKPGTYTPNRELPTDKWGVPVPDAPDPHTQLGRSKPKFGVGTPSAGVGLWFQRQPSAEARH
jgi:RHS repeat-associated protein